MEFIDIAGEKALILNLVFKYVEPGKSSFQRSTVGEQCTAS